MSVTSGFFNSVSGDRKYNADDISNYFEGLISSGVIANPLTSLQVTAEGTDMTVQVQAGRGIINNRWIKNTAAESFAIAASDGLLSRIDCIVMKYVVSDRQITLEVKQGTAATTPIAPTMTRGENTIEYCLAQIYVAAGATKINQSNITDTRPNATLCGFVTNLVDNIDISTLYAQWEAIFARQAADFEAWYAGVKESLAVPTKVVKYENSYTTTGSTTTFNIGIPEYETGDAILVHLGGILLKDSEYTVNGTGASATITLPTAASSGRTYTAIVFKATV